jgi:peptidoglycan hydrolase-like protein with peptidoglycan-binding domain
LGANETTGAIIPSPKPQAVSGPEAPAADKKALIGKIQAGLRAFGNQGIEVDGLLGARTKAGIKEFQGLFRLAADGRAGGSRVCQDERNQAGRLGSVDIQVRVACKCHFLRFRCSRI